MQALAYAAGYIVSASSHGDIVVWKLGAQAEFGKVKHVDGAHGGERVVSLVALSALRPSVASCGFDGVVKVWSLPELEVLGECNCQPMKRLFCIDSIGRFIAVGGGDDGGTLGGCLALTVLFSGSLKLGTPKVLVRAHADNVYAVAFTKMKDTTYLWSGGRDGAMQLRDVTAGSHKVLRTVVIGDSVRSLAVSTRLQAVYVGTSGGTISVFDALIRKCAPLTASVHHRAVYGMAVCHIGDDARAPAQDQGAVLFSCGKDGCIRSLHGTRPTTSKRQGDPGMAEEWFMLEPDTTGAPPFLESIVYAPPGTGRQRGCVVAGSRDGRLVAVAVSLRTDDSSGAAAADAPWSLVKPRPAALADAPREPPLRGQEATTGSMSLLQRPTAASALAPTPRGPPPQRKRPREATAVKEDLAVGSEEKRPVLKKPATGRRPQAAGAVVKKPAAQDDAQKGSPYRLGSFAVGWQSGARWEPGRRLTEKARQPQRTS